MAADKEPHAILFVPPQKKRLSEDIYAQIKEAILSGAYKPGQRLPTEKLFCENFQVGRAVVREALRQLENSGLIYVRPGSMGGAFVKNLDPSILANTLEGIVRLNHVSPKELTAARVAIETAIFRIVIEKVRDSDLVRLQKSIDQAREALETGVKEPRNVTFHLLLAEIAGNKLLMGIIEGMLELEKIIQEEKLSHLVSGIMSKPFDCDKLLKKIAEA